jgi:hypothetical protein
MTADLEKSVSFYLSKKTVLLQKYLSVTGEFIDALKRRGSDTPEPFLLRRQSLIQEIEDLDRSFQTTVGLLGQKPPELSGRPRESIRERVESMRRILAEAGSRDKALNELAKEESDSLRGDLLRFRTARNAAQGYGKAGGSEPRFLDTRK